jgi:hypothetical protein
MGMQHHHTNVVSYGAILRLLVLHTLQVCLVLGGYLEGSIFTNMFLQGMPHGDKRLVVFLADVTNELPDSDAPYWELAEKTIAARRGTAKQVSNIFPLPLVFNPQDSNGICSLEAVGIYEKHTMFCKPFSE